ncbi:hypothetical protein KC343_g5952 [Hortaea werneckii]|nr:hypothetical protein KC352_g14979 [Hortaea werneckii]KAI7565770.1 hypothetical protein KC317_g6137 [Hortaea werneckii]KAI7616747.1 hypothetical protein KC346_g5845 [Hortaea werneckii]KAI7627584.1 hypothetical protein KC343_g5952 [Hortaea werneckii]KAI7669967.1 hypothetical protein KC319_g6005 [Hortaea werneckii]
MHSPNQYYKVLLALALPFASGIPQQISATTSSEGASSTGLPSGLPSCAEPALFAAIQASGCQATDAQCICSNPQLVPSLMDAVESACDVADRAAVAAFAKTYCASSTASSATADPASSTMSMSTAASTLPESITASSLSDMPSGTLIVDTASITASMMSSSNASLTTSATTTANLTKSMLHSSTSSAKPTNGTSSGAAEQQHLGSSFAAFAVAVFALAFCFAEL